MSRIAALVRRIHLFRTYAGHHTGKWVEAAKDMEWAQKLREVRREARGRRPVYTPPQKYVLAPDRLTGLYESVLEVHHPHKDVVAGMVHNLDMLNDLTSLHRPGAGATDNPRPVELQPTQQSMGYWHTNGKDIAATLAPHVIAAFANARADDTVTSGATFPQYVRDFLSCKLADLDLAVRADKLGLAVGRR